MITAVLVAVAAAVAVAAPRVLVSPSWVSRAPVLGIAAWCAVVFSVAAALALAAVSLVIPWPRAVDAVCSLWRWCGDALGGAYGLAGHLGAVALVGLVLLVGARAGAAITRVVRDARNQRRQHRDAVVLVGSHSSTLGATVLDHPEAAAFLVPGRQGGIVVTTAAVALLSGAELAAVLAHERAHAAGRHHLLGDGARSLEQAFPWLPLFATARGQISRLMEIRADQVAVSAHAPIDLARALVAMATGAASSSVLAVTGGDAVERVHRMLCPPAPLHRGVRAGLMAATVAVALLPIGVLTLAWAEPILAACLLG